MPGELLQAAVLPMVSMGDIGHLGQSSATLLEAGAGTALTFAGLMGAMAIKSKMAHSGDSHNKPAEIREARARFVKPWESGLLMKNGSFYDSVPVLDSDGMPVVIDGVQQFTKEFHKVITPGFNGAENFALLWRKLTLANNLPDEATFQLTHIQDKDERTYNLTGGMTWAHVQALDEHKRPMVYRYYEPSADGKRPAGPISAAEALHNAIMTGATRAEVARQLTLFVVPEVVKRLHGESDPQQIAIEPEFYIEIERAVHDRFLDRGAVLLQVGVAPNVNPETEGANAIARAMDRRTKVMVQAYENRSFKIEIGGEEAEEDETVGTMTTLRRAV